MNLANKNGGLDDLCKTCKNADKFISMTCADGDTIKYSHCCICCYFDSQEMNSEYEPVFSLDCVDKQ